MGIIIWNANGAASEEFLRAVKEIIRVHKPDILGLLETRISGDRVDIICRKLGFDYWLRVEAHGYNGGIWCLWRERMEKEILETL